MNTSVGTLGFTNSKAVMTVQHNVGVVHATTLSTINTLATLVSKGLVEEIGPGSELQSGGTEWSVNREVFNKCIVKHGLQEQHCASYDVIGIFQRLAGSNIAQLVLFEFLLS